MQWHEATWHKVNVGEKSFLASNDEIDINDIGSLSNLLVTGGKPDLGMILHPLTPVFYTDAGSADFLREKAPNLVIANAPQSQAAQTLARDIQSHERKKDSGRIFG